MTRREMIQLMALSPIPLGIAVAPARSWAQAGGTGGIRWHASLAEALREARRTGQPVMLSFDADWCPYCRRMARETFTDADVIALSHRFVCAQVEDGTASGDELEERYHVEAFPMILFLDSAGHVLRRVEGFRSAGTFAAILREMAPAAAGEWRSFWFYYQFEPRGERFWRQINHDTWCETYPDGRTTLFRSRGPARVDGVPGTVVRRLVDHGLDVFIPDDLAIGAWIRFCTPGETRWSYLAQVRGR